MNTSRRTLVHTPARTRPGSTTRKATSHRALVAGILATTALAFTACSAQGNEAATDPASAENANAEGTAADATAAETTTITQTENGVSDKSSGNTPNPTGSAPDQGDDTTTAETGGTSTSSSEDSESGGGSGLRQDMTAEIYNNPSPGSTFMAAGEQATTCIYGDGYGLNLIAAGPNTSCDFAKAVFNQQTKGAERDGGQHPRPLAAQYQGQEPRDRKDLRPPLQHTGRRCSVHRRQQREDLHVLAHQVAVGRRCNCWPPAAIPRKKLQQAHNLPPTVKL